MYKQIMIPLGLNELNPHVLAVAEKMASLDNAQITLVHVVQTFDGERDEETETFYKDIEKNAEKHLKSASSILSEQGVDSSQAILFGDRIAEVLRFVEDNNIDLIVLESHQIDRDNPTQNLGSFSHQIGIFSPCAVLMVR